MTYIKVVISGDRGATGPGVEHFRFDLTERILSLGQGNLTTFSGSLNDNVLVGFNIMPDATAFNATTALGSGAMRYSLAGRASVAVGFAAGQSMGGASNSVVGAFAMKGAHAYHLTDQGPDLPRIGEGSATGATGGRNTIMGEASALIAAGDFSGNSAYGYGTLFQSRDSQDTTAVGTGACALGPHLLSTVAVGSAAYRLGSGEGNTFAGKSAGEGYLEVYYLDGIFAAGDTVITLADATGLSVGAGFWISSHTWNDMVITAVDTIAKTVTVSNPAHTQADAGTAVLTNVTTGAVIHPTNGSSAGSDKWTNPTISTGPAGWNVGDTVTSTVFAGSGTVTRVTANTSVEVSVVSASTTPAGAFLYNLSNAIANEGVTPSYPVSASTVVGSRVWTFDDVSWATVGDIAYATDYAYDGTTISAISGNDITLSTPLINDTGETTFGNHIPLPHVGKYNSGYGFGALLRIQGTATKNIAVGFKAGGSVKVRGNKNILIGDSVDVPAEDTNDYLNIQDVIVATGTSSPALVKVGIGAIATTDAPAATLEVGGSFKITESKTLAQLGTAAAAGKGAIRWINNSQNSPVWHDIAASGGTTELFVYSDEADWRYL